MLEAAALEPFDAVAIEVVSAEFAVSGGFCHQVVSDLEHMATDREHCPSMPYGCAQATIARAKGGVLGAAGSSTGFHQRGTQPAIAPAGLAAAAFTSALMIAGTHASPA